MHRHITKMVVPSTCCKRAGGDCICASQAKCSCGQKSALHCNCDKAATENAVKGARCSCRESILLSRWSCVDDSSCWGFQEPVRKVNATATELPPRMSSRVTHASVVNGLLV